MIVYHQYFHISRLSKLSQMKSGEEFVLLSTFPLFVFRKNIDTCGRGGISFSRIVFGKEKLVDQ